jgi:hypothetical protein
MFHDHLLRTPGPLNGILFSIEANSVAVSREPDHGIADSFSHFPPTLSIRLPARDQSTKTAP